MNNSNQNNNKEISYKQEKIQELLNIINTLPYTGFDNAFKLARIFEILNEPFNLNNKFPNPEKPTEKEIIKK